MNRPVVAITGGTMGLGYALARQLLTAGLAVSLCARSRSAVETAVEELSGLGPVFGIAGDVTDPFFQTDFVKQTATRFGRLDAFVNNASTLGDLPLPELTDTNAANLRKVLEVNTVAPVLLLQYALPHLTRQSAALVLSISSDASRAGYPAWGVYGASKAALDLLTRAFAHEYEHTSVQFYSVDPGDMQTAMHEAASPGDSGLADPVDVAAVITRLFRPLLDQSRHAYASGARLQVAGTTLVSEVTANVSR